MGTMTSWRCLPADATFKYMPTPDKSQPALAMCRPEYFGVQYEINPWMEGNIGRTDTARARDQWCTRHALRAERG